jgi:hypothetical protein
MKYRNNTHDKLPARSFAANLYQGPCNCRLRLMMMLFFAWLLLCLVAPVRGDTLQLRNGTAWQGGFVSFDGQNLVFATSQGVQTIHRNQALVLTFASSSAEAPPATPETTSSPAAPAGPVTVPAGTVLLVRVTSQVSSNNRPGYRFSAKLEGNLKASGVVVAPTGTVVYGRVTKSTQARRLAGRSTLELALSEINNQGTMIPLMTSNFAEAGKSSFRKTARNAGMGALIGGAFGDSDDAKKGAAIGAAASVIRKGDAVVVPVGAILEFRLTQPLTLTL